jgi:hypothetical protein
MLEIPLGKLTVAPEEVLNELEPIYAALREHALQANDLRAFLCAEATCLSMRFARKILAGRYRGYALSYLKAESQDDLESLYLYVAEYLDLLAPPRMPFAG